MATVTSCENTLYCRTPLIWSPMGKKKTGCVNGVAILLGRFKFHDSRAIMTNRPYIAFAFFEQLTVLINKQLESTYHIK